LSKEKILIIDDEPINISLIAQVLSKKYDLAISTDPKEGLDLAKKNIPSLILLDIIMPEIDGYEVIKKLKEDSVTKEIPVIFLTAKSDPESMVKGFKYGAVDYIHKPFVKEELLARVQTHLKVHSLNRSLQNSIKELEKKNNEILKKTQEFEMIFSQSYDGIALTDLSTNFLLVNDAYERITGYTKEELYTKSCRELSYDDSYNYFVDSAKSGKIQNVERKCNVNGKNIYVNMSVSLMPDQKTLLLNTKDITETKKIEQKIQHYAEIMDENVISSSTDLDGKIITVSKAFEKISKYTKEELIGKKHSITKSSEMPKKLYEELWNTISNNKTWKGEIKNKSKDGELYWSDVTIVPDFDDNGKKVGYTAVRQNITFQKKIEEIAIHDELTQLFNRRHFNDVFEQECNRVKRSNLNFLFMMLDVDYFKNYNDTYGHQDGDKVLVEIGKVLNSFTKRSGDFAFRLGGEEFGIIAQNRSKNEALLLAEQIRKAIESLKIEHEINSNKGYVTASIGMFFRPLKLSDTTKAIYKECDELLYEAKKCGRNQVVI